MSALLSEIFGLPGSLLRALRTLFGSRKLLAFTFIPYLVGFLSYVAILGGVVTMRKELASVFVSSAAGIEVVSWLVLFGSVFAAGLLSLMVVLVLAALVLEWFVEEALRQRKLLTETTNTVWAAIRTLLRAVFDSLVQLSIVLGLTLTALLLSVIPILSVLAFCLAGFALGLQLFDFSLSALRLPLRQRLRLIFGHKSQVFVVGALFSAALLIPLGGVLLLPVLYLVVVEKIAGWGLR